MSKESKPNITRRNVLAGIGASGVGLALGAHGVAAGEKKHKDEYDLPVAIDWQEALYKGGEWKHVEAFPDEDDDGKQDDDFEFCDANSSIIDNGAETPLVDIDDPLSSDLRTDDDYTDAGDPLIDVHGVKPGYGGEVTLSYHICDEPGKLKLEADDVAVDKKLSHLARARVWYDEFDGSNDNDHDDCDDDCDDDDHDDCDDHDDDGEYKPVLAQGSLKHVLHKLKKGVHISGDPYVASPKDQEGVHYYGYPRVNTSDSEIAPAEEYVPKWITVENVDEFVDGKKIEKIADRKNVDDLADCFDHVDDGLELCIDGVGYAAMDEDKPLPDLCIEVKKVITGKKGKPVGFEWESNLPICRIEIASGDDTNLNVFDRARSGTALAPLYDDDDDDDCDDDHDDDDCDDDHDDDDCDDDHDDKPYGRRRPITGVRFGVCSDHDEDDWCIENSNTGYVGFEWWIPKHTDLKKKGKIQANFDFEAKSCDGNST